MQRNQIQIHNVVPPEYGYKIFDTQLASELSKKNAVIDQILSLLQAHLKLDTQDETWIRLCLDEVIINAIRHGNHEDPTKKVAIALFANQQGWAIRVEDEGEGFSVSDLPNLDGQEYWEAEHGRGILLIQSYMDEIWYYDKGNRVQLFKRLQKPWRKWIKKICQFFRVCS